jgi:hypothetical protein
MGLFTDIASAVSPGSIDSFKSTIGKRGGLAKTNRFAVFMSPPDQSLLNIDIGNIFVSAISGNFNAKSLINDPRDIGLLCESCSIPGRQIQTMEHSHFRQSVKVANSYFNEDVTFVFHLTNDYYMKKMFDKWTSLVINPDTFKLNYDSTYKRDVTIQQLNEKDVPVYGITLRNAYPVTVQSVELNNSAQDSIQKLSITMTYEDFVPEGGVSSALSGIKNAIGGITRLL